MTITHIFAISGSNSTESCFHTINFIISVLTKTTALKGLNIQKPSLICRKWRQHWCCTVRTVEATCDGLTAGKGIFKAQQQLWSQNTTNNDQKQIIANLHCYSTYAKNNNQTTAITKWRNLLTAALAILGMLVWQYLPQ